MTWTVDTIIDIRTDRVNGYTISNEVEQLPLELFFLDKENAVKLAKWLNNKESYTLRLEGIIEMNELDVDLDKIKKQHQVGIYNDL